MLAGRKLADVIHVHDVLGADARSRLRFALESTHDGRLSDQVLVQDLDGDLALNALMGSQVDGAHTAPADHALDAILAADDRAALQHQNLTPIPLGVNMASASSSPPESPVISSTVVTMAAAPVTPRSTSVVMENVRP